MANEIGTKTPIQRWLEMVNTERRKNAFSIRVSARKIIPTLKDDEYGTVEEKLAVLGNDAVRTMQELTAGRTLVNSYDNAETIPVLDVPGGDVVPAADGTATFERSE